MLLNPSDQKYTNSIYLVNKYFNAIFFTGFWYIPLLLIGGHDFTVMVNNCKTLNRSKYLINSNLANHPHGRRHTKCIDTSGKI